MSDTLAKFIAEHASRLEAAGVPSPRPEVELILCHILGLDRLHLYLGGDKLLTDDVRNRFEAIMARRLTRYPLQYILGESWFYGRRFGVNESVMAPTPETELLCEAAIRFVSLRRIKQPRILDIGVGSGVIAVTMALEMPESSVVGLDVSPSALEVAKLNAATLGAGERIEFRQSDFFASVKPEEKFDLILSNPPYIADPDYAGLPPEVLADPKVAMTSGDEGLDAIRVILREAPSHLANGGRVMFEIGYDQSEKVAKLTETDPRYRSISIHKDFNDIDRIVILGCDE